MTRKPDLGVWIAGIGAVSVIAAIIAGFLLVGGPGEARAQRLDAARLAAMQEIATAAQCAYTFTDQIPASLEEIRTDIREHRTVTAAEACNNIRFAPWDEAAITYEPENEQHIRLCADFLRPSPPQPAGGAFRGPYPLSEFPELQEPRPTRGRHCYSLRLVKQIEAPAAPL